MSNQKQTQKQFTEIELQQNYTVMQDLLNVLGILVEYLAVKESGNQQLSVVYLNRLILQINLSNTAHNSLFQQARNTSTQSNLMARKNEALTIFNTIISQLKKDNILKIEDNYLKPFLQTYSGVNLNNYQVQFQQFNFYPIEQESQFDQNILQKVIDAMDETDDIYKKVKKGYYKQQYPEDQIQIYVMQRYENTKKQLKQLKGQQNNYQTEKKKKNILSPETQYLIRMVIDNLYQTKNHLSRDFIYTNIISLRSSKNCELVIQELSLIKKQLKSKQMIDNLAQLQKTLQTQEKQKKENLQYMDDNEDLQYLQGLIH